MRLLQIGELELHLRAQFGVERGQRFVEEQHLRPHDEATRQRDALALAARHLVGHPVFEAAELYQLKRFGNAILDLAAAHARDLEAVGDIVGDAHVRKDGIALEHHVHRPLVWRDTGHILPVDQDMALGRQFEAGDHAQQRRLAAARRAEQHEELACHDVEADVIDRGHLAEAFGDILDLDDRLGRVGHGQWVSAMALTP